MKIKIQNKFISNRSKTFIIAEIGINHDGNFFKCKKLIGEVVNVGSDNEISIKNIVNDLRIITNQKLKIKIDKKRLRPKKSEVLRLRCNSDKLFRYTGWRPSITFKQGLQKTYQWFSSKENKKFYKDRKYSI